MMFSLPSDNLVGNDLRGGLICENDSMPAIFLIHGRVSHLEHKNREGVAMTSSVWGMLSRWSLPVTHRRARARSGSVPPTKGMFEWETLLYLYVCRPSRRFSGCPEI